MVVVAALATTAAAVLPGVVITLPAGRDRSAASPADRHSLPEAQRYFDRDILASTKPASASPCEMTPGVWGSLPGSRVQQSDHRQVPLRMRRERPKRRGRRRAASEPDEAAASHEDFPISAW